jgi:hypothetical protein
MNKLFRIKPLEKKSVEAFYDVYETLEDGSVRGWTVTETYRWGQGFREMYDKVYDTELDRVRCDPVIGWGCELDDLCGVWFEFDDTFTDEEKAEIEQSWEDGGAGWLYDGDHNWLVEDDAVYILGPVQIDIVSEESYNEVLQSNIKPVVFEPSDRWPFDDVTFEEEEAFKEIERRQPKGISDE